MTDGTAPYERLAKEYVEPLIGQYDWRANWHRRNFRFSGNVVIIASASLPLLAVLEYSYKDLVVAAIGVVIGTLTGLRTFYRWDQMCGLLRRSQFEMSQAYRQRRLDYEHARTVDEPTEAQVRAYEATKTLLEKVATIRGPESDKFFEALDFPPYGTTR